MAFATPDRAPGPSLEEEIQMEDRTADGPPAIDGAIRLYNGDLVGRVGGQVLSLTQQGGLLPLESLLLAEAAPGQYCLIIVGCDFVGVP